MRHSGLPNVAAPARVTRPPPLETTPLSAPAAAAPAPSERRVLLHIPCCTCAPCGTWDVLVETVVTGAVCAIGLNITFVVLEMCDALWTQHGIHVLLPAACTIVVVALALAARLFFAVRERAAAQQHPPPKARSLTCRWIRTLLVWSLHVVAGVALGVGFFYAGIGLGRTVNPRHLDDVTVRLRTRKARACAASASALTRALHAYTLRLLRSPCASAARICTTLRFGPMPSTCGVRAAAGSTRRATERPAARRPRS